MNTPERSFRRREIRPFSSLPAFEARVGLAAEQVFPQTKQSVVSGLVETMSLPISENSPMTGHKLFTDRLHHIMNKLPLAKESRQIDFLLAKHCSLLLKQQAEQLHHHGDENAIALLLAQQQMESSIKAFSKEQEWSPVLGQLLQAAIYTTPYERINRDVLTTVQSGDFKDKGPRQMDAFAKESLDLLPEVTADPAVQQIALYEQFLKTSKLGSKRMRKSELPWSLRDSLERDIREGLISLTQENYRMRTSFDSIMGAGGRILIHGGVPAVDEIYSLLIFLNHVSESMFREDVTEIIEPMRSTCQLLWQEVRRKTATNKNVDGSVGHTAEVALLLAEIDRLNRLLLIEQTRVAALGGAVTVDSQIIE